MHALRPVLITSKGQVQFRSMHARAKIAKDKLKIVFIILLKEKEATVILPYMRHIQVKNRLRLQILHRFTVVSRQPASTKASSVQADLGGVSTSVAILV